MESATPGSDDQHDHAAGQQSSAVFDILEVVVAGACLGGLYAAGQASQWWTAFFAGTTLLFIYFERHHRKQLDIAIGRRQQVEG